MRGGINGAAGCMHVRNAVCRHGWSSCISLYCGVVQRAVSIRFRQSESLGDDEKARCADYLFGITTLPPSGEHSLHAFATLRMGLGLFARQPLTPTLTLPQMPPITMLYGSRDWMWHDSVTALAAKHGPQRLQLQFVPQAGHHLYLDNADACNALVVQAMHRAEATP